MTRTKKILAALAITIAAAGIAATPAVADSHTPAVPMSDHHLPTPPQG